MSFEVSNKFLYKKDIHYRLKIKLHSNFCIMDFLEKLITLIDTSIRDDAQVWITMGNIIKSGYSIEIDDLKHIQEHGYDWIVEYQKSLVKITNIQSLKIKYTNNTGYFIEISKNHLSSLPENFILKQTLLQASRYTTQELQDFEEKLLHANEMLVEKEYNEFLKIRSIVQWYFDDLYRLSRNIEYIDFITNGAHIAHERRYVSVDFSQGNHVHIVWGKHPVVSLVQKDFISNDLLLSKKERIHLITWPNMWGKSTFLRQNALLLLMGHMGYFIPAQNANVSLVDKIFSRVGAWDNIFLGQSTFMVEMQEVSFILRNATKNSFIIIDEIGRGTSTYDGMSLAWSILKYIHSELFSKTLFATHYHEIIDHAQKLSWVKNFSVAVGENDQTIVFLRKIIPWSMKKSYGIEVAKLAGIPDSVLMQAREMLQEFEFQKKQSSQLSLEIFQENNKSSDNDIIKYDKSYKIIDSLEKLKINELTPLQALTMLSDFQQEVKKIK